MARLSAFPFPSESSADGLWGEAVVVEDEDHAARMAVLCADLPPERPLCFLLEGEVSAATLRRLASSGNPHRRLAVVFHGPRETIDEFRRGESGGFRRAAKRALALKSLAVEGVATALVGLLTRSNFRHATEYLLLAEKVGAPTLGLTPAVALPLGVRKDETTRRSPFWAVVPRLAPLDGPLWDVAQARRAESPAVWLGAVPPCVLTSATRRGLASGESGRPLFSTVWLPRDPGRWAPGDPVMPLTLAGACSAVPACAGCAWANACPGPVEAYVRAFGDEEFLAATQRD